MSLRTGRPASLRLRGRRDPRPTACPAAALLILATLLAQPMFAQARPAGPRDDANAEPAATADSVRRRALQAPDPLVLPYVALPADLQLTADRANAWPVGPERRVHLQGDARIAIGSYRFRADNAVVFISPVGDGPAPDRQLEIYLDRVREVGDAGPIQAEAPRLLVTARVRGKVKLTTDRLDRRPDADAPLVRDAEARVQRYYNALRNRLLAVDDARAAPLPPRPEPPGPDAEPDPDPDPDPQPQPDPSPAPDPDSESDPDAPAPEADDGPPPPIAPEPPRPDADADAAQPEQLTEEQRRILAALRQIHFRAGRIAVDGDDEEDWIVLRNEIRILFRDPLSGRDLTLTADRGVIFLDPGAFSTGSTIKVENVRGVYLEDNVILSSGDYTIRGPRVFYDLQNDRALILKSVFYTWSVKKQVPLYVRADKILQVARGEWRAEKATFSTSEFFEPHFALGMDRLTIKEKPSPGPAKQTDGDPTDGERPDRAAGPRPQGDGKLYDYRAQGVSFRVADVPVFYWPGIRGEAGDVPLRSLNLDIDSRDGLAVRSRWDLFGLANRDAPDGVAANLLLDGYTERGPAVGLDMDYQRPRAFGDLDAYLLYDRDKDEPGGRQVVDPQRDFRGRVHWQHRHELAGQWQASVEVGWASDPTFLEEFFANEAYADKPWESSFYAKKQVDDRAFTLLFKFDPLDFLPQLARLQTPGYTVEKLPEVAYHAIGAPLLGDRLTWFSETRGGLVRLSFPEQTPQRLGFSNPESLAAFGFPNNVRFDDRLDNLGLHEDNVARFDTRHELAMPLTVGPVDAVPYLAGRFTAYDDDFDRFPGGGDNLRLRAQAGLKLHADFARAYDNVDSRLLDLHRLRHIVEPSLHANFTWTNVEQSDLPVFDNDVESLAEGAVLRLGLRNTLQTQRGDPGERRSVDWLRLDTDIVLADGQTDLESPIARFFDHRPGFSLHGDHFWSEVAWQVTDTLAAVANLNHSFESDELEQWNVGLTLDHNPGFTSFVEVRRIEAVDSLIARIGFSYLLSAKYHLSFVQTFDLEDDDNRGVSATLTRRLPRALLVISASFDEVTGDTSVGIAIAPEGSGGRASPEENPFIYTR